MTTFDPTVWARALLGDPPPAATLAAWRLTPPRLITREAAAAESLGMALPGWVVPRGVPLTIVADQFMVSPAAIRNRCRRWGLPIEVNVVGRDGGGWRRLAVVPKASYLALRTRTLAMPGTIPRAQRRLAWARGSSSSAPAPSTPGTTPGS